MDSLSEENRAFLQQVEAVSGGKDVDLFREEEFDVMSVQAERNGRGYRPYSLPSSYLVSEISYREVGLPFVGGENGLQEADLRKSDNYVIHVPEIVDRIFQDTEHTPCLLHNEPSAEGK